MRFTALATCLILFVAGCSFGPTPKPRTPEENQLFGPVSMRLDSFSKVKDWTGRGLPDGIEAVVEFDDRFGDHTKAAGTVLFELFEYRPGWPDPRGARLVDPWSASLQSYDEQKAHWERASGAYSFELAWDAIRLDRSYVLTATFDSPDGARFFSQIVIQATVSDKPWLHKTPATTPSAPVAAAPVPAADAGSANPSPIESPAPVIGNAQHP
jgi:hypothetical protein